MTTFQPGFPARPGEFKDVFPADVAQACQRVLRARCENDRFVDNLMHHDVTCVWQVGACGNSKVNTPRGDIGQDFLCRVGAKRQMHIREFPAKFRNNCAHRSVDQHWSGRKLDLAAFSGRNQVELITKPLQSRQDFRGRFNNVLAEHSQFDTAMVSYKQRKPQVFLEFLNARGQRRLGQIQLFCGAVERAAAVNSQNLFKVFCGNHFYLISKIYSFCNLNQFLLP
nr:hypothetical protein [Marinicella sp. W31]MDC2876996.1 hypothetical protein [Marinicella sp. W31]